MATVNSLCSHAARVSACSAAGFTLAREALKRRYEATAEYPKDADSLVRMLAAAGVDFSALRDPLGRPFRAAFRLEGPDDVLEIIQPRHGQALGH